MKREAELGRRLAALEGLGEAIGAMKSLAAHHFREARQAVAPARAYRDGVARIAASTEIPAPTGDGASGLLIVGADLGLCGSYNTMLIDAGARRRAELGDGPTLCLGRRAAALLRRRGLQLAHTYDAPTGIRGIPQVLLPLAEDVLSRCGAGGLTSFHVVSARFGGVGATSVAHVRLLPVACAALPSPGDRAIVRYVDGSSLARAATRELLYITLYDLLVDALACEHGARLVATQAAESWLGERARELRGRMMAARREASTQEVIEIAAGARARGARS